MELCLLSIVLRRASEHRLSAVTHNCFCCTNLVTPAPSHAALANLHKLRRKNFLNSPTQFPTRDLIVIFSSAGRYKRSSDTP